MPVPLMIAFRFRLERALAWRNTELTREEARLEQLQAELRAIETAAENVRRRRAEAQTAVARASAVTGSDLAALETFRAWALAENTRLAREMALSRQAIAQQKRAVALARGRVKLLDRLKEKRYAEWRGEADREMEELAGEAAVAQWRRENGI